MASSGVVQGGWETLAALGQSVLGAMTAPFETVASVRGSRLGRDQIRGFGSAGFHRHERPERGFKHRRVGLGAGSARCSPAHCPGLGSYSCRGGQGALSAAQSVFSGITTSASVMADGLRSVATGIAVAWSDAFSAVRDAAGATWNWIRESAAGAWDLRCEAVLPKLAILPAKPWTEPKTWLARLGTRPNPLAAVSGKSGEIGCLGCDEQD